jgi:hypothetical protein
MANTRVDHVTLTVTTVGVFIETMKFINQHDLWDEVEAYLKANHKTEMFVDYDVFHFFREMLGNDKRFDEKDPVIEKVIRHRRPFDCLNEPPESQNT